MTRLRLNGTVDHRHAAALSKNPTLDALERIEAFGTSSFASTVDFAHGIVASERFSEHLKSDWRGYTGFG